MGVVRANSTKEERIQAAPRLSWGTQVERQKGRENPQSCAFYYYTTPERDNETTRPRKAVATEQRLLTPVEEETVIKWAIQYHKWGPLLVFSISVNLHLKFYVENSHIQPI